MAYASTDNQIWITDSKVRIDTIVPHKPDVANVEIIDYTAGVAAHYQVRFALPVQLLWHTAGDEDSAFESACRSDKPVQIIDIPANLRMCGALQASRTGTVCWLNTNYTGSNNNADMDWLEPQSEESELPGSPGELVDVTEGREELPDDGGTGRVVGYFAPMADGTGRPYPRYLSLPRQ